MSVEAPPRTMRATFEESGHASARPTKWAGGGASIASETADVTLLHERTEPNVLDSPALRRIVANTLISQKRYHDVQALNREHIIEYLRGVDPEHRSWLYVNGHVDLDEWEQIVEYALKLRDGLL